MDDSANVRQVDAHSKCNGGHNNLQLAIPEVCLDFSPFLSGTQGAEGFREIALIMTVPL